MRKFGLRAKVLLYPISSRNSSIFESVKGNFNPRTEPELERLSKHTLRGNKSRARLVNADVSKVSVLGDDSETVRQVPTCGRIHTVS